MIEIFNFKEVNSGMIAANFSIRLEKWGNFCIYNLVFFKNRDNNTKWIAVPCQKTQKEDRMKYYRRKPNPETMLPVSQCSGKS